MTKTKLAFVRCRLSCFSRRPVRFFPVFSLLPVRCCSPVVVFAVRHWDLPAFSRGGFFAIVFLFFIVFSFPSSGSLFSRLFPFACPLLFACRRFRCPALGLAGFFPRRIFRYRLSVFLSSFPSRRPVCFFPRLFPFAGISLPCLSFPSSLFVSGLSFLLFSSLFSPFCFFFFTGKRQVVVRPADMAAVWR